MSPVRIDELVIDRVTGFTRTVLSTWQPRSTYKFVPRDTNLRGKVAVVTGGSSGAGRMITTELARMGATVYTGCRRYKDAAEVQHDVEQAKTRVPGGRVHASFMDLTDLVSVKEFAGRVTKEAGQPIDILILDAAIAGKPYSKSAQGHEIHYATIHLGHYCLTRLLLEELIKTKGRVVVIDSQLHALVNREGRPDDKHSSLPGISLVGGWLAYCRSNLTKLMFAYELQRRYPQITVPIVHPGVLDTNLSQVPTGFLTKIKAKLLSTAGQGAQTPLYCATADDVKGGIFYHNVLGTIATSSASQDPVKQQQVWELSERLCEQAIGALPKPTSLAEAPTVNTTRQLA